MAGRIPIPFLAGISRSKYNYAENNAIGHNGGLLVKRGWFVIIVLLFVLASGCGDNSATGVQIEDAWVRAATVMNIEAQTQGQTDMSSGAGVGHMSGSNTAAYMVIYNHSSETDRLLRASSDVAHSTELHISEIKDGVMSMHPVDSVEIPANDKAELKPGGLHIMLIGINKDLVAGEKMTLSLEFEKAGAIQLEAEVRAP
jgi:periplasmic copper chaperone A